MRPEPTIQQLHTTLESALTVRYHAVPTVRRQTVGEHVYGVLVLLNFIAEDQIQWGLYQEALLHDSGEIITGDIPYTTKRDNPEMKALCGRLEYDARCEHTIRTPIELNNHAAALLKMADTLEGLIWCSLYEDRHSMVQDRWHQAYRRAAEKFADVLHPNELKRTHQIFTHYQTHE